MGGNEVFHAFQALDIAADSQRRIAEILDADKNGTISFAELIRGVGRLRGTPNKADIVSVELMVSAAHTKLDKLCGEMETLSALVSSRPDMQSSTRNGSKESRYVLK